jgi:2-polyprenyl-3-methyl-5-hydroxy-6-metoxy-1,4-benzoquinol methylase
MVQKRKENAMEKFSDKKIIDSWKKNAAPWVQAIREGEIKSRIEVTNKAIEDTILGRNPSNVLDIGCGEGWLVRRLTGSDIDGLGVDVVPELIKTAQADGGGRFKILSYEELKFDQLNEKFDVAVCNFSLIGKESVEQLFEEMPSILNPMGAFIIQTIHPEAIEDDNTGDGWRSGSWDGFNDQFSDPAPWYFRTITNWKALFSQNGFAQLEVIEPTFPNTGTPASVIFVGEIG